MESNYKKPAEFTEAYEAIMDDAKRTVVDIIKDFVKLIFGIIDRISSAWEQIVELWNVIVELWQLAFPRPTTV